MRLLTPYPRHHRSCDLAGARLSPSQLAGLLDGDGSLALLRRPGSSGVRVRPQISLVMRDDDPTPLAAWASAADMHGEALGILLQSNVTRRHEWRIDRLHHISAILEILVRHPPLSPRGFRQVAMLREATLILTSAVDIDGSLRNMPPADLARLSELRATIPARATAPSSLPPSPTAAAPYDHRAGVLGGLLMADGCISLRRQGPRLAPSISLVQRIDNLALLEDLQGWTEAGSIRVRRRTPDGSPLAYWEVSRLDDLAHLLELLDRAPLPACTPKAAQLEMLRQALALKTARPSEGALSVESRGLALARLHHALRTAKQYRGRTLLCSCEPASDPPETVGTG